MKMEPEKQILILNGLLLCMKFKSFLNRFFVWPGFANPGVLRLTCLITTIVCVFNLTFMGGLQEWAYSRGQLQNISWFFFFFSHLFKTKVLQLFLNLSAPLNALVSESPALFEAAVITGTSLLANSLLLCLWRLVRMLFVYHHWLLNYRRLPPLPSKALNCSLTGIKRLDF